MGDKTKGLYKKFTVIRLDGSSSFGGKHENCKYFVLDLSHDPHAIPALVAYADSCSSEYPSLAIDLDQIIEAYDQEQNNDCPHTDTTSFRSGIVTCDKCGARVDLIPKSKSQEKRFAVQEQNND